MMMELLKKSFMPFMFMSFVDEPASGGKSDEEDAFAGVEGDDNDLGVTKIPNDQVPDEEEPDGEHNEFANDLDADTEEEEKKKEAPKETEEEVKGEEEEPKEESEEMTEEARKLLDDIKVKSPLLGELIEKKNFKTVDDVAKAYEEAEKGLNKKGQLASAYKKLMEGFIEFDDEGNPIGYTEEGKKRLLGKDSDSSQTTEGKDGQPSPVQTMGQGKDGNIVPTEEALAHKEQFFDLFEDNPIEAVTRIATAVAHFTAQAIVKDASKGLGKETIESLRNDVKPLLERYQDEQRLSLVNEVVEEATSDGDTYAEQFFQTYGKEIGDELRKMDSDWKRNNPKLSIRQAYDKVKLQKYEALAKQLKTKHAEQIEKGKNNIDTGRQTGGGGRASGVDPVIAGMVQVANSKPDAEFF